MSEISSEANKRRVEEKILELNNQLFNQGLNRSLNPLHHTNLHDEKFSPLEFLTHGCIYSLLEPKKWQNESEQILLYENMADTISQQASSIIVLRKHSLPFQANLHTRLQTE